MENQYKMLLSFLLGVVFLLGILLIFEQGPSESYKRGQIDALTGKVSFQLVTQSDSTRVWKLKDRKE